MDIGLHSHPDAALGLPHCDLCVGTDRLGQFHSALHQLFWRTDRRHQADLLGLGRTDDLGSQNELHGLGDPHDTGQTLRPAEAGCNPQAHLGLTELGLFTGQADVTGHGQLASAAQRKTVDRGDHRLGQILQLEEHISSADAEFLSVTGGKALHFPDVGPRHKGAARTGEDDHIDLILSLHSFQNGVQIREDLTVEGIERIGPVDGDDSNVSLLLKLHKCHSFYLLFLVKCCWTLRQLVIFLTYNLLKNCNSRFSIRSCTTLQVVSWLFRFLDPRLV